MHRNNSKPRSLVLASLLLCCLAMAICAGCDDGLPPLGRVSGQVTLDSSPLPGADVFFVPESGIQSYGRTDEQGRYKLSFVGKKGREAGALLGKHRVMINTLSPQQDIGAPPPKVIPPRYNTNTTLTAEVKQGTNQIDFPLKSGNH